MIKKKKKKTNLLPEDLCGAEASTSGAVASGVVPTETCVGYSITGPGQRALERAAQVVKRPRYNDVIVETHQCGHADHPNANTYKKRHRKTGYFESGYRVDDFRHLMLGLLTFFKTWKNPSLII